MKCPEFDTMGYPTDDTIKAIAEWPYKDEGGFEGLLDFVASAWHWPRYWSREGRTIHASTGGWSGNESIIAALEENRVFWWMCWQQSRRGGHFVFEIPETVKAVEDVTK